MQQNIRAHHILFYLSHKDRCNVLTDNQHGLCTGKSCDTQLLRAINCNDIQYSFDTGNPVDALFLETMCLTVGYATNYHTTKSMANYCYGK